MRFIKEFCKSPRATGAIAASSGRLAKRMIDWVDWKEVSSVMELGPGTGSITKILLDRMPEDTRCVAIEINEKMCDILHSRYPALTLHNDTVENIENICRLEGIGHTDCILSGLPWANFSAEMQNRFLSAIVKVLRPGGYFCTFAYLQGLLFPAGKRFKHKLSEYFSLVSRSRVVWMNLPPAFVYMCRK